MTNNHAVALDLNSWIDSHADKGCLVAPKCITCPLEQCVLDEPSPWLAVQRWHHRERNERIKARVAAGVSRAQVAMAENMSVRAVDRVLQGRAVG